LPYELKASKTTSVNKDHSSTIKPVMLTKQLNQDAERHSQLITKELQCRGAICTHTPSLRGPLLPWGSQNLTRNILNFAAYFCVYQFFTTDAPCLCHLFLKLCLAFHTVIFKTFVGPNNNNFCKAK